LKKYSSIARSLAYRPHTLHFKKNTTSTLQ